MILTSEKVYKVQTGGEVRLECDVTNLGDMILMWKQGRRVLTAGELMVRRDARLRVTGYHGLVISRVVGADRGVYSCQVCRGQVCLS